MSGHVGGVAVGVDRGQDRGPGLTCSGIGLCHARTRGAEICVVADGELDERVQLITAESAIPVVRGPGCARGACAVFE